jgi:DNA modification methylase
MSNIKNFKCKLFCGNAKEVLKQFPDNTFHCSITSPPYWDQRDYKVEGQLGQEDDLDDYINGLVDICREVKRTLRNDGTFWVNIGDGFCKKAVPEYGLKPKELTGVPWLFAIAMRKDGWYVRSDIIWAKTNPMPDSAKDRPSKSYEHILLFTKSPNYFYDWYAIADQQKEISIKRAKSKNSVEQRKDFGDNNYAISGSNQDKTYKKLRHLIDTGATIVCNRKDVWHMSTANNTFKHFAMYPDHLVEPCLIAGTSSYGCCPKCKTPWNRIETTETWEPGCKCGIKEVDNCLILDPFNGSGTTGIVAYNRDRNYVGIDINPEYLQDSREFLQKKIAMYSEVDSIKELMK